MFDFTPTVRVIESNDAQDYLDFLCRLDEQSPFMHYRKGERSMTLQGMRSRIRKQERQGNSYALVALGIDDKPIAYFSVNGGNSLSSRHSATVAVGVLSDYRLRGIASRLVGDSIEESLRRGVNRYECTVVQENYPAVDFYYSQGFRLAGYFRNRFYDGLTHYDELVFEHQF